ncbi:MAG: hypothetical protein CM15mP49_25900 [Actinomycetota bacterium]|nr:MAG: hypothetical protein CM15mP49_25900 [Actinomycetota bacterium]
MLGVLQQGILWNTDSPTQGKALMAAMCAVVILVALIARPQTYSRFEKLRDTLSMGETRPIPTELQNRPEIESANMRY